MHCIGGNYALKRRAVCSDWSVYTIGEESKVSAQQIVKQLKKKENICIWKNHLYVHSLERHYWRRIQKSDEEIVIKDFFDEDSRIKLSSAKITEVIKRMKSDSSLIHDFESYRFPYKVNCKNGVVDIRTHKVEEYKKNMYFDYVINMNYIKESIRLKSCFSSFVSSSLEANEKPEKKKLLLQILGYLVSDFCNGKVAFFFIGESNSGKSVLLEVIKHVIGEDTVTTIPLNRLGDRFFLGELSNARINVCSEVSTTKIKNADVFKAVVSGDRLIGEHKGQSPFYFNPRVKLLSAGNTLPQFGTIDGTDSVINRIIILRFNKSIPKKDWNLNLKENLLHEANSIFSYAIDELDKLVQNNFRFEHTGDGTTCLNEYGANQNSFNEFLTNYCKYDADYKIHKYKLWEAYQLFCKENGYELLISIQQFNQKVVNLPAIHAGKFRLDGKPLAGWMGITLKDDFDWSVTE